MIWNMAKEYSLIRVDNIFAEIGFRITHTAKEFIVF